MIVEFWGYLLQAKSLVFFRTVSRLPKHRKHYWKQPLAPIIAALTSSFEDWGQFLPRQVISHMWIHHSGPGQGHLIQTQTSRQVADYRRKSLSWNRCRFNLRIFRYEREVVWDTTTSAITLCSGEYFLASKLGCDANRSAPRAKPIGWRETSNVESFFLPLKDL